MDGENNRTPYEQMDDLGVPLFLDITILFSTVYMYSWAAHEQANTWPGPGF